MSQVLVGFVVLNICWNFLGLKDWEETFYREFYQKGQSGKVKNKAHYSDVATNKFATRKIFCLKLEEENEG